MIVKGSDRGERVCVRDRGREREKDIKREREG